MLGPAMTAIRAWIEAHYTALPCRWANEDWEGANPQTTASPFVEIEVIGGTNFIRGFSKVGNRLWIHQGLIRFYIWSPWNTGMDAAMATADTFATFMERAEFGQVPAAGQTVRTLDFSTYDNVAADEAGNYAVLLASVPFDFYYTN
jgi:hypothetical protein